MFKLSGERLIDAALTVFIISIVVMLVMMEECPMASVVYPTLPASADEWTVTEIRAVLKEAAGKGKAVTLAPQLAEEWARALDVEQEAAWAWWAQMLIDHYPDREFAPILSKVGGVYEVRWYSDKENVLMEFEHGYTAAAAVLAAYRKERQ